ncbi:response regulator, partial [Herbaspirillum sp. HC18]
FLKMATKLGAVASLQKPFRPDALLAMVDHCLKTSEPEGSDVRSGRR